MSLIRTGMYHRLGRWLSAMFPCSGASAFGELREGLRMSCLFPFGKYKNDSRIFPVPRGKQTRNASLLSASAFTCTMTDTVISFPKFLHGISVSYI